jgi:hypothetical protein
MDPEADVSTMSLHGFPLLGLLLALPEATGLYFYLCLSVFICGEYFSFLECDN